MSILPVTQYCGLAAKLSEEHGAGRAAAISTVAHARAAKDERYEELYAALSDEEQLEVASRVDPAEISYEYVTLHYEDAVTEQEVYLYKDGMVPLDGIGEPISIGHVDMFWNDGFRLYVMDIKASRWTVPEGTRSLQLHAYALGLCDSLSINEYVVGLFFSEDGAYAWSDEVVDVLSERGMALRKRVEAAAMNTVGEANHGSHCRSCYARLHCPEHALAGTSVEALESLVSQKITPESAAKALDWLDATKDVVKRVEATLKHYAEESGGVRCGDGKVWASTVCSGRMGVDLNLLRKKYPEVYEDVYRKGSEFKQFRRMVEK